MIFSVEPILYRILKRFPIYTLRKLFFVLCPIYNCSGVFKTLITSEKYWQRLRSKGYNLDGIKNNTIVRNFLNALKAEFRFSIPAVHIALGLGKTPGTYAFPSDYVYVLTDVIYNNNIDTDLAEELLRFPTTNVNVATLIHNITPITAALTQRNYKLALKIIEHRTFYQLYNEKALDRHMRYLMNILSEDNPKETQNIMNAYLNKTHFSIKALNTLLNMDNISLPVKECLIPKIKSLS